MLHTLIHLLFPERAHARCIRDITDEQIASHYTHTHFGQYHSLASYKDPIVRAAIHELKYHRSTHACALLGVLLNTYTCTRTQPCTLLPIPLSRKRFKERGFNQTELLAQHVVDAHPQVELDTRTLVRTVHRKPQSQLAREERLHNVTNVFRVRQSQAITHKHVIVLDDVATTGATLRAAKDAILPHRPASLTLLAIAH